MSLVRKFARPLLASSFIISGVERLKSSDQNQPLSTLIGLTAKVYPAARVLVGKEQLVGQALAGTQVAAASLFALGKAPRLASAVLLATGAINALAEYQSTPAEDKAQKSARTRGALTNASLLGAIAITSVDTDGNPSLAWRASKLGDQVAKRSAEITEDVKSKAEDIFG